MITITKGIALLLTLVLAGGSGTIFAILSRANPIWNDFYDKLLHSW